MSVSIVDLLEVIQVHDDQTNRVIHAPRTLHFEIEQVMEVAIVAEPRQRVGCRQSLRLLIEVCVLERDGYRRREKLEDFDVVFGQRLAQAQVERAEGAATGPQRYDKLERAVAPHATQRLLVAHRFDDRAVLACDTTLRRLEPPA